MRRWLERHDDLPPRLLRLAAGDGAGVKTTIDLPIRRDIPLADQCGHGKLWKEPCAECEIVWLTNSLERDEPRVARDRAKLNQLLAERTK